MTYIYVNFPINLWCIPLNHDVFSFTPYSFSPHVFSYTLTTAGINLKTTTISLHPAKKILVLTIFSKELLSSQQQQRGYCCFLSRELKKEVIVQAWKIFSATAERILWYVLCYSRENMADWTCILFFALAEKRLWKECLLSPLDGEDNVPTHGW